MCVCIVELKVTLSILLLHVRRKKKKKKLLLVVADWLQCMIEIARKVLWCRFMGSVSAEMEDLFSAILMQMLDF
jgi:hypothetical protein